MLKDLLIKTTIYSQMKRCTLAYELKVLNTGDFLMSNVYKTATALKIIGKKSKLTTRTLTNLLKRNGA